MSGTGGGEGATGTGQGVYGVGGPRGEEGGTMCSGRGQVGVGEAGAGGGKGEEGRAGERGVKWGDGEGRGPLEEKGWSKGGWSGPRVGPSGSSLSWKGRVGLRVLDVCGGLGTVAQALLRAGHQLNDYWLVEKDEKARRAAAHHLRRLEERGGREGLAKRALHSLPPDLREVTEEMIRRLGRIDLFCCAWPCQGLSRAAREGKGLADERSGLFAECYRLWEWVREYSPGAQFVFENVVFCEREEERFALDWRGVCDKLGEPLVFDAARVSPAHRLRAYWHSLGDFGAPEARRDRDLRDYLDEGARPRRAKYNDQAPYLVCNARGEEMRKFPTLMASGLSTYSVRAKNAMVWDEGEGALRPARVGECERMMGLQDGDTAAPGLTDADRRKLLGNMIDVQALTYVFQARDGTRGSRAEGWERGVGSREEAVARGRWGEAAEEARDRGGALAAVTPGTPPREVEEQLSRRPARNKTAAEMQPEEKLEYDDWLAETAARFGAERGCSAEQRDESEEEALGENAFWRAAREDWVKRQRPEPLTTAAANAKDPARWIDEKTGLKLRPEGFRARGTQSDVMKLVSGEAEFLLTKEPESNVEAVMKKPAGRRNLGSCGEHIKPICAELKKYEEQGMTETFDDWLRVHPGGRMKDFAAVVHRWGATGKKGTEEIRPYMDCRGSGLNECMAKWPMKLPTPESVAREIPVGWVLGKRDFRHGFYHIVGGEKYRKLMGFSHPITGKLARFVVLAFGPSLSPAIFWEVVLECVRIFRAEAARRGLGHVQLHAYCDDIVIAAPNAADMEAMFKLLDEVGDELGVTWKSSKDEGRAGDLTAIDMWGLELTTEKVVTLTVPADKKERYKRSVAAVVQELEEKGRCSLQAFESMAGQLAFCSRATRWGRGHMDAIWDSRTEAGSGDTVKDGARLREDLSFWEALLGTKERGKWEGRTAFDVNGAAEMLAGVHYPRFATDASGSWGWGCAWESEMAAGRWTTRMADVTICWKELYAVLQALKLWRLEWQGRSVRGFTDNVATMSVINSGRARSPEARKILREIAILCTENSIHVHMQHIAGVLNVVPDELSRGAREPSSACYKFRHMWYKKYSHGATVDVYCDEAGHARQEGCDEHFSAARPASENREKLVGKKCWMNPPWRLAEEAVKLAFWAWRQDPENTVVTLLVPKRTQQSWHRRYVQPGKDGKSVLHTVATLGVQQRGEEPYFEFFGGDYWGGVNGGEGAEWAMGERAIPTGPCKFELVVLRVGGD